MRGKGKQYEYKGRLYTAKQLAKIATPPVCVNAMRIRLKNNNGNVKKSLLSNKRVSPKAKHLMESGEQAIVYAKRMGKDPMRMIGMVKSGMTDIEITTFIRQEKVRGRGGIIFSYRGIDFHNKVIRKHYMISTQLIHNTVNCRGIAGAFEGGFKKAFKRQQEVIENRITTMPETMSSMEREITCFRSGNQCNDYRDCWLSISSIAKAPVCGGYNFNESRKHYNNCGNIGTAVSRAFGDFGAIKGV